MFSALKKLTSSNTRNEANGAKSTPGGLQTMHASLQKKFAKGVHYNMKIIIRGDRNVGKTCLFHRLQGKGFFEEYVPTQEIQVASIHWNYKATDDIVKVEVWDVVDKGKKKKPLEGLKLNTATVPLPEEPALDAEFLDVYKGTNGVIMMLDITKQWTFDYIKRELPKIPKSIPVIVLANHRDMGHHRCISEDDVKFFIDSLDRKPSDAQIRYGESSMRNSFGLKLLHKFFNLPFLALQRDSLLKQLETNKKEMDLTNDELDLYLETDDASYDKFLDLLTQRRRQNADALNASATATASPAPCAVAPGSRVPVKPTTPQSNQKIEEKTIPLPSPRDESVPKMSTNNVSSVDDFVVEGDVNDKDFGFLSSTDETKNVSSPVDNELDSESEEEPVGNPMVMGFQDEIDDEDFLHHSSSAQPAVQISDSSDEDSEEVSERSLQFTRSTVEESTPIADIENDLDDWLNDKQHDWPDKQTITIQETNVKNDEVREANIATDHFRKENKLATLEESESEDLETKVTKKTKDKKSKRKPKKSKRERNSPDGEESEIQPSQTMGEYEEI